MPYDVILGRNKSDKEKFGSRGLVYLGKGYVKMGNYTSLSNKIWMDVARSHVVLVAGKRGSGKSYSLGVIAEELSNLPNEESKNIASLIFDTMGIFWTMKFPNEKDIDLLNSWDLKPKNLPVKVFVPIGKSEEYKQKQIPFDETFAIAPNELGIEDWLSIFNLPITSIEGTLIQRIVSKLPKNHAINEIINEIEKDDKSNRETKQVVSSLFEVAQTWGIFSKTSEGTKINSLTTPGVTTVLDISTYSSTSIFNVRALVISLISRKLFQTRLESRKKEELSALQHGQDYLSYSSSRETPLVWIFLDECHEFLPKEGKTPATDSLIQILREGRQPGISLVLATQQPGQIHKDVMTQSDLVISHRVTAAPDVAALNSIMQSYLLTDIQQQLDDLPSDKGSAILLDDNSERIYPIRVRPRFTWHGGEAPTSVKANFKL